MIAILPLVVRITESSEWSDMMKPRTDEITGTINLLIIN